MKKQYTTPATIVANIETEQLICESTRMFSLGATEGADLANDRDSYDDDEDLW